MPVLKNTRHECFAQLLAAGNSATAAYEAVYGPKKGVRQSASRMSANVNIAARVTELQRQSGERAVLTLAAKREFLYRVVMTPIGEVDEHSDLCQRCKFTVDGRAVTMPDKLRAIELDAKLAGELRESAANVNVAVNNITLITQRVLNARPNAIWDNPKPVLEALPAERFGHQHG